MEPTGKGRGYDNLTMIKALEEVDEELAIKAVSNPDLDGKELSELIEYSLGGKIVLKDTMEPLKLSNKVMVAALRNRVNQIIRDKNLES